MKVVSTPWPASLPFDHLGTLMLKVEVARISKSDISIEPDEIAKGGDANVYRGVLLPNGKPPPIHVAVKHIRVQLYGEATRAVAAKVESRILRELSIWSSLQANSNIHPHILPLLGVIDSVNGLLDFVSEYCTGSLSSYLQDYESKPRRIEIILGTLQGLTYMHELSIVHGDLKPANVLVTSNGVPKICDFGHSHYIGDYPKSHPGYSNSSSSFQATTRYMSPEFFRTSKTKPTIFSDVWAFGCLALEILSQLHPYHTIQSEFLVSSAIRGGVIPSVKPEYPNAAGCLNDVLWSVVKTCWYANPNQRPTSSKLLESIHTLVVQGLVNPAAATPERPALPMNAEPVALPPGLRDYAQLSKSLGKGSLPGGRNSNIIAYYGIDEFDATKPKRLPRYVVKSFSIVEGSNDSALAHYALENVGIPRPSPLACQADAGRYRAKVMRQTLKERFPFQHQNVVRILGIDSNYGQHFGYVLECCDQGNFVLYKNKMAQDEALYTRYMIHILNGLEYMHSLISPMPHGDLTPRNIMVDRDGNLKLTSFSFSRLIQSIPLKERKTLFENSTISARYMSPELLQENARPTPESDMWAFGNVAFWIFTGLEPYPLHASEHDVALQIVKGATPNEPSQLADPDDLDTNTIPEDSLWLTNGIWSSILRCWSVTASHRLSATQFLRGIEDSSDMSERLGVYDNWRIAGVQDLTGRIRKSETRNYGVSLSWSRGVWRAMPEARTTEEAFEQPILSSGAGSRTTLSQGLFRFSIEVVVKGVQLTPRYESNYAARQAIRHEILLLKQIKHSNICSLIGFDQQYMRLHGVPGIVLEYHSKGKLQEYYDQEFPNLDASAKRSMLEQLGKAIHYLHNDIPQGPIVHGNLSMESILVDNQGMLKLSNFEFACQYAPADNVLEAPVIFAPPIAPYPSRWHAPEFFEGEADSGWPNPTQFADIWSLGCLMIAIWTNTLPFANYDSPNAISNIIAGDKPYSLEDCPAQLLAIANQLWTIPSYNRISAMRFTELIRALDTSEECI